MLVALWLFGALGLSPQERSATERPTQAYAHAILAEWLLAHGDRVGAIAELQYALIFDHEDATLKARLASLDHSGGVASAKKKSGKSTGWLSRQMRSKKTLDTLPMEDKTSRRVAESAAD